MSMFLLYRAIEKFLYKNHYDNYSIIQFAVKYIRFLNGKGVKATEIRRQMSEVYGESIKRVMEWQGSGLELLKLAATIFMMRKQTK